LMQSIVAGMEEFAAGTEPHDDQTLLLISASLDSRRVFTFLTGCDKSQ
jgi:hypothetical protein